MISKITDKFQITIPKKIRQILKLSRSDIIEWKIEKGLLTIEPLSKPFLAYKGKIDVGKGDIKRDIAYHGDVLNTASRIQHQCNKLNKKLLNSKNLESQIQHLNGFDKEFIDRIDKFIHL